MKVLNINECIRKYMDEFVNKRDDSKKENNEFYGEMVLQLYDLLKNNDGFYYILGIIFTTSYMVSNFVYELFPDGTKEKLEYLESFNSLDELNLMIDEKIFMYLFEDIEYFNSLDLFSKKEIINDSLSKKEILNKMFPCYLLDVLYYLNPVNSKELLELYYENYNYSKDKNVALEDTVCQGVDDLIELESQDFYNYKIVILDIIEEYYKYNMYLKFNNLNKDEYSDEIMEMIESDLDNLIICTIDNYIILEPIVRSYVEYNTLSDEQKIEVEKFYNISSNKSKLLKVLKKSNDLKNNI